MQTTKNRPVKTNNYETHRDVSLPSRKTRKGSQAAKIETLRRKSIRQEKYERSECYEAARPSQYNGGAK